MNPPTPAEVRRSAEAAFASGLYCAESVLLALAKAQGIESELVPRVATAFCAGMSRTCGTCGALTGAIMGMGLALGRSTGDDPVQPSFVATQKLIRQFEQEFGSSNCRDLLMCDLGTPEGQLQFREDGLIKHCAHFTGRATEIAAQILAET